MPQFLFSSRVRSYHPASRELNRTLSQLKHQTRGQRNPEGGGEAIYLDENFRALGIVAENPEIPLELSVKLICFQSDNYFSLPAGLDVRIEPHYFHTSSVFYFGNGEEGISGIENLEHFVDSGRSSGQIPGIIIIRQNGNRGTRQRITGFPQPSEEKNQTQSDCQKEQDLLHRLTYSNLPSRLSRE
jgi:hypothetical protein